MAVSLAPVTSKRDSSFLQQHPQKDETRPQTKPLFSLGIFGPSQARLGAGGAEMRLHDDRHITAGVLHQAGAARRSVSWVRLFGDVVRPLPPKGVLVPGRPVSFSPMSSRMASRRAWLSSMHKIGQGGKGPGDGGLSGCEARSIKRKKGVGKGKCRLNKNGKATKPLRISKISPYDFQQRGLIDGQVQGQEARE